MFLPHPRVKFSIVGSLRDREVACSASDRQGSNFESCVWKTVSSQSSQHPQEVLLAQFSLYVHKGGPIHFISFTFQTRSIFVNIDISPFIYQSGSRRSCAFAMELIILQQFNFFICFMTTTLVCLVTFYIFWNAWS